MFIRLLLLQQVVCCFFLRVLYQSCKTCELCLDMQWLDPQYHDKEKKNIIKPNELKSFLCDPPEAIDEYVLDGILGSMIGLALGDALGAHVEFRPRQYLIEHPVTDLQGGGTWGLQKGQVIN